MPPSPAYRPDPAFLRLGPDFADPVQPARFPKQIARFRNLRAAATVGLDTLTEDEWAAHFARFEPLPDNQPQPLAMRYHGHQFRVYNPEIGDGRGFLLAQLREAGSGRLLDLGTKGSGQTPYSRFGDGRLTLKGGVREVLAAEMLEALGVPTSRAFALYETGEGLQRGDEPSPTRSSVLTRLSWSHVRFGTFQRHAFHDRADLIQILIDHVVETYYPELAGLDGADRAAPLLVAIAARSATLAARWMAAGFVHGVLNTDNMNVTGESFDYGPYRFLPYSDLAFTAAYFDQNGLYAYGRQPQSVFWNLTQLAGCLNLVADEAPLVDALNGFKAAYEAALREAVLARLGLRPLDPESDTALIELAFRILDAGGERLRWEPFFFDWFCGDAQRAMNGPRGDLYRDPGAGDGEGMAALVEALGARIAERRPDRPERLRQPRFSAPDPEELLYDEIEAIWARIDEDDDWTAFDDKVAAIRTAGAAWAL
jgi:protein adenylyltransferase